MERQDASVFWRSYLCLYSFVILTQMEILDLGLIGRLFINTHIPYLTHFHEQIRKRVGFM